MQRYRSLTPYVLLLVCIAAMFCVAAQNKESGSDPYTPTKLEWLCTYMNATFRVDADRGYQLTTHYAKPNTLVFSFVIPPEADREFVHRSLQSVRQVVELEAKHRGWDQWLIMREEIHVIDPDKKSPVD